MDESALENALSRGVAEILPGKKGLLALMKKKKITLYQGFDPTSENLHIGHWIGIRKLAEFQKLGHKVVFLIGDFTAMIGDPTDKTSVRQRLTKEETINNAKGYKKIAENILNFAGENPAIIKFNSDWLSKMNFEDVVELASNFTVQQMLERDFFQKRLKNQKPIYLHEFLYPLLVGQDCVELDVDLEIGGSDQLFNMMAGRSLMKALKGKEKYVLTLKLLEDPNGKKMGKTEGNAVNLSDTPQKIYGGIMALEDGFIDRGIEILTDLPLDFSKGKNPMDAKKALAFEVVKQIKGEKGAHEAEENFAKTFQQGTPEYTEIAKNMGTLAGTVGKLVGSNSQAKRLIDQGGVYVNGKRATNPGTSLKGGEEIKIGKRKFVKVS